MSSNWAQLPTELLSLIVACSSLRPLLRLALVNRRLHRLLLHPSSTSLWSAYPPATVTVEERAFNLVVRRRMVRVGGDIFQFKHRDGASIWPLFVALRNIPALRLDFDRPGLTLHAALIEVPLALCPPLQNFTQLRALEIRGMRYVTADSLAAALDSLPSLITLLLANFDVTETDQLVPTLHRLCSTQLDHLTLSRRQLHHLVKHQPSATMPRLCSLAMFESWELNDSEGRPCDAIDSSWTAQFPSLLHLSVADPSLLRELSDTTLPPLASFQAQLADVDDVDLAHISAHSLSLRCFDDEDGEQRSREKIAQLLRNAPPMQQLTVADVRISRTYSAAVNSVFSPAVASPACLSTILYLEWCEGLTLADWTYLLTPTSPPIFAGQLTHLALAVQRDDVGAAAAELPSLPAMYPALTHVHVGVQFEKEQRTGCAEWDAAVQAVRSALGAAWCDSADGVLAWREDVAWKRSVGIPAVMFL